MIPTWEEWDKMSNAERRKLAESLTKEEHKEMDEKHVNELKEKMAKLQKELFYVQKELIVLDLRYRFSHYEKE